jgi:hypothetical protein
MGNGLYEQLTPSSCHGVSFLVHQELLHYRVPTVKSYILSISSRPDSQDR